MKGYRGKVNLGEREPTLWSPYAARVRTPGRPRRGKVIPPVIEGLRHDDRSLMSINKRNQVSTVIAHLYTFFPEFLMYSPLLLLLPGA